MRAASWPVHSAFRIHDPKRRQGTSSNSQPAAIAVRDLGVTGSAGAPMNGAPPIMAVFQGAVWSRACA